MAARSSYGAVELAGSLQVLTYQEGTVRVLHRLTPLGVAMAGPDIADPYKD